MLLRRRLIAAVADENDRRCMHYIITEEAVALIDEIADVKREMDEQILRGITQEELEFYKKISDKMLQNIRQMI
jgi:DNA-binding MarR family transcriptional regulator